MPARQLGTKSFTSLYIVQILNSLCIILVLRIQRTRGKRSIASWVMMMIKDKHCAGTAITCAICHEDDLVEIAELDNCSHWYEFQ